jgi:tetratricopeptide (TPR) repeat protein
MALIVSAFASAQPMATGGDLKKEKATLAKLTKEQTSAKAAFAKKPKDAKVKKAYVDSTVKLATASMVSPALSPREKYPTALKYYREALKVDPNNKEAKNNSEMIISIYKSMGRPVPKG